MKWQRLLIAVGIYIQLVLTLIHHDLKFYTILISCEQIRDFALTFLLDK